MGSMLGLVLFVLLEKSCLFSGAHSHRGGLVALGTTSRQNFVVLADEVLNPRFVKNLEVCSMHSL